MSEDQPRPRFRFSLRTLFVVVTMGCCAGGLCRYALEDVVGIAILSIWVLGLLSMVIVACAALVRIAARRR